MYRVALKAPAKINLYLEVLGKRPDGFHEIKTIFEKIDLCDEIILKRQKQGIRVICKDKDVPEDERNLAFQAARILLKKTDSSFGVEIRITKNIPVASGLGGGSSDAASVLLGLNKLLNLRQGRRELLKIAAQIGSDVPFFVLPALRALGCGKGELLTSLKIKKKSWYILVIPNFKISTRRMYQDPRITLTKPPRGAKIVFYNLKQGNLTPLNRCSYNSFEPVLIKRYKKIQEVKKALESLGVGATLVSGSGPCVFGVIKSRKEAVNINRRLQVLKKDWQIIITRTYSNSKNTKED